MKTMIFAAGLGTRLKPLTDTMPKALVPVGGKPLIEHVLDKLSSVHDSSTGETLFSEAVVNVHHFADSIETWIKERKLSADACRSMSVRVSDERSCLLETGGGILHARPLLQGCGSFLVHNVDILSDLDVSWFVSQVARESLATLLVSSRKTSRYLLFEPETMRLVGWTNVATGEVRSPYPDLDPASCLAYAFSGIHILSDKVFDEMDAYVKKRGLSDNPRFPIMDFYLYVCAFCDIRGVVAEDLKLVDVGKLDSLEQAESLYLSL